MHSFRAQHFPALDGFRGLAILLVITHHQLIPYELRGGFLGVDLFFVLSGFLITSLLLKEFECRETISLKNFYMRRVLRLAPALLLYLFVSLVITYRNNPEEFQNELKLVGLALAYMTNWRMALGWDYTLDPTAIIWSLSVEEQFYLLWPPLLYVALAIGMKRRKILIALTLVIVAVTLHRFVLALQDAELNRMYYGTDTRVDAPLVGCLVSLVASFQLRTRFRALLQIGAVVSAVFLIYAISYFTYSDQFLYRGGYTLVAVAAGLLIWSLVEAPSTIFAQTLSFLPLRWFGLISYGLYLWHWLLLRNTSFYYWVGDWDAWTRFVFALSIAAASYYLIELRFNRLKTKFGYAARTSRPVSHETEALPMIAAFPATVIQPSEQNV